jgi:hypothetical protein
MCQVNGCVRFLEVDPVVKVSIPHHGKDGRRKVDVELCSEHASLHEAQGFVPGLMVPDTSWPQFLADHYGVARE